MSFEWWEWKPWVKMTLAHSWRVIKTDYLALLFNGKLVEVLGVLIMFHQARVNIPTAKQGSCYLCLQHGVLHNCLCNSFVNVGHAS